MRYILDETATLIITFVSFFLFLCFLIYIFVFGEHLALTFPDAIGIDKFQSIFQLGAAICITLTIAGPQIRPFFAKRIAKIATLKATISALTNEGIDGNNLNLAQRGRVLDLIEENFNDQLIGIEFSNPQQLAYYIFWSGFNLFFLMYSTFYGDKIPALCAIILVFLSITPPMLVPLDAYRKVRKLVLGMDRDLKIIGEIYKDSERANAEIRDLLERLATDRIPRPPAN